MAKSTIKKSGKGNKAEATSVKALSAVKDGRVSKPAQASKAKSKEIAKNVVAAQGKNNKKDKKTKKEPTPEPESESESESEVTSGSDSETSDSSSSESEAEVPAKTSQPAKTNGAPRTAAAESSSSSDDTSNSDNSEEPESDDEVGVPVSAPAGPAAVSDDKADTLDEADSSEESQSEEENKPPAKAKGTNGAKVNGVAKQDEEAETSASDSDASTSDEADETSDEDSSDESESESESEQEAPSKKRKAEAEATPAAKKTKTGTETPASEGTKNLFVGNLSWNIDEEWLTREFEGFGEIVGCRIITDKNSGRSKGFGYVEFAVAADAAKAQKAKHGAELDGRNLNVDFSQPRQTNGTPGGNKDRANQRAERFGDRQNPPSETLFVGNISFDATPDLISEQFGQYGTITRVSLPTDQETGALKGFGYVGFSSTEEAQEAMNNLNGTEVAGRNIRLDFAMPRSDDNSRGGARGGRGGRGSFGGRGRGGFGDRGARGGRGRGGSRGGSTNRGGFGDFQGKKVTF